MKRTVKRLLYLFLQALPVDAALRIAQRITAGIARVAILRDWTLAPSGLPKFYKHQANLLYLAGRAGALGICSAGGIGPGEHVPGMQGS